MLAGSSFSLVHEEELLIQISTDANLSMGFLDLNSVLCSGASGKHNRLCHPAAGESKPARLSAVLTANLAVNFCELLRKGLQTSDASLVFGTRRSRSDGLSPCNAKFQKAFVMHNITACNVSLFLPLLGDLHLKPITRSAPMVSKYGRRLLEVYVD